MAFYPAVPLLSTAGGTITGPLTITGLLTTQLGITNSGAAIASSSNVTTSGVASVAAAGNVSVGGLGHLIAGSNAVVLAAGANAGTGPPAPVLGTNSSDNAGSGTFGTGTTPAAGAMVAATFSAAFGSLPAVVLIPANAAAQALGLYVSGVGTGGFTVSCVTAPAASQANSTYAFEWLAIG